MKRVFLALIPLSFFEIFIDKNIFVLYQVRIPQNSGNNGGMVFNAIGTSMATGNTQFGGLVYVYTNKKLLFWVPKSSNGHLVYIGSLWGSNQQAQTCDQVEVNITIYYLSGNRVILI